MGVNDSCELYVFLLATVGFFEKVCVTRKENAAKACRSIQQVWIGLAADVVILNSPDINASLTKAASDGRGHVFVHVELQTHLSLPSARNRSAMGEGPACSRISWAC